MAVAISSNGDRWLLGRDKETMNVFVVHEANQPSGGAVTHVDLETFLTLRPNAPEHQALLRLIGTLVEEES
jgi:hypothetical protein